MKKSVLALAMAFGVTSAFAQDLTSKKGEPILPEAGDWAISADASPILGYLKGLIGNGQSGNQSPAMNFVGSHSLIMGKYFKDEKTAYRVGLNIGFNTQSATNMVAQDNPPTAPAGTNGPLVSDKSAISTTGIGLTAGIEKRKGKTRLQGYYGAELGFYIGSQSQKNTYGNSYAATGTAVGTSASPMSTTWSNVNGTPIATGSAAGLPRVTQNTGSSSFSLGVRGFLGIEYFILPKMSIGGEFGWGLGITTTGAGKTTSETIVNNLSTSQTVTGSAKTTNFNIGTDNKNSFFGPSGSIRANFYF